MPSCEMRPRRRLRPRASRRRRRSPPPPPPPPVRDSFPLSGPADREGLVRAVEALQRSSPLFQRAWDEFCRDSVQLTHDPNALDDQFLVTFLRRWHPRFGGRLAYPVTTAPHCAPPSFPPPHPLLSPRLDRTCSVSDPRPVQAQRPPEVRLDGVPPPPPLPLCPRIRAASLRRARGSRIWQSPPRDQAPLMAYLERHDRWLALLVRSAIPPAEFGEASAYVSVLKRMLIEGRRERRRRLRSARAEVSRATGSMTMSGKAIDEARSSIAAAQDTIAAARASHTRARVAARRALAGLGALRRDRSRSRRSASSSSTSLTSSERASPPAPRGTSR